jgi:UDP-N-acetylglucosamine 3-dehydrogenase
MTTTIGIGIIGGGGIAAEGHICGYQSNPRCQVLALSDVDQARAQEQAARLGVPAVYNRLEDLLERDDIQAVSVCSPDHLHGEHCYAALQAGKHVLCEKPLCTSWEDAARLVRVVRTTGLTFLVGHV